MNKFKAKELLKDKFWIVEDAQRDERVGVLSVNDENKYMYNCNSGTLFFDDIKHFKSSFNADINWIGTASSDSTDTSFEIYDYPTRTKPYNVVYDIKHNLPLYTKSETSKSLYAAGFYIIRFNKGWLKANCPKLITLETHLYKGPFKTDIEARQELSRANASEK